jgi:hypothetical protein
MGAAMLKTESERIGSFSVESIVKSHLSDHSGLSQGINPWLDAIRGDGWNRGAEKRRKGAKRV